MSLAFKLLLFLCFTLFSFITHSQEKKKVEYGFSLYPFQQAIISNDQFTPILNSQYSSFDINISRSCFDFLASKKIKNKWIAGIGFGIIETKSNWIVGFNKSTNFSSINTLHTYANQVTLSFNFLLGYQIFNNTTAHIMLAPNFKIYSKSNQQKTTNKGSFISSSGFRADYEEFKGNYGSLFSCVIQFKTNVSNSFSINYGLNTTYYWSLYSFKMISDSPFITEGDAIIDVNIGGLIPFGYIGFGYKFNSK